MENIGIIIFDEMNWTGAEKIYTALLHIKNGIIYMLKLQMLNNMKNYVSKIKIYKEHDVPNNKNSRR